MIRRPPRSTLSSSSAASDVYKRQVNEREARLAQERAETGAALAAAAGLQAEPRAVEVNRPIVDAIIAYAEEIDAPLIALGSRGRSGPGSMLLGDVAQDVVQRATRMVVI